MVSQTLSGAKHNIHSENNALGGIAMPADRLQLSTLWVSKNQLRRSWKRHTNSMRLFTLLVKLFQIQQTRGELHVCRGKGFAAPRALRLQEGVGGPVARRRNYRAECSAGRGRRADLDLRVGFPGS